MNTKNTLIFLLLIIIIILISFLIKLKIDLINYDAHCNNCYYDNDTIMSPNYFNNCGSCYSIFGLSTYVKYEMAKGCFIPLIIIIMLVITILLCCGDRKK